MSADRTGRSYMAQHRRITPWLRATGGQVAACSCGWRSQPCANGEFANQAWERHAATASESGAEQDRTP